jgi:hypothetical protein
VDAGGARVQAVITAIRSAYDVLLSAFNDLPEDQTLGDAASTIESKAAPVVDAVEDSISNLGCP